MGRVGTNSLLAGIKGKVGPVYVSGPKSNEIVKIRPDKKRKQRTSKTPTSQQTILKEVGNFFRYLPASFFRIGYRLTAKDAGSHFNASTSYHMKNAIIGKYPDLSIDLSKVKFSSSRRYIENCWNAEFISIKAEGLQISWEINPYPEKTTQLDDVAVIVFYTLKTSEFRYVEGVPRSDCSYIYPPISSQRGKDVACWIFFVSADKKMVSATQYLGIVRAGALNLKR